MRAPTRALSKGEFIALMAVTMATVAFSIDSMLPVLPEIAARLTPEAPNNAQLIVTAFVLGMGAGTFVSGPLSDTLGRKTTIVTGFCIYIAGSIAALFAPTLETLLLARLVQGVGASGPRIVSAAIIRDLYEGRRMAQILSFVMMIFIMIPAIAPFLGSLVIGVFGWRSIFVVFVIFALIAASWMTLRQPETLPRERRRPFRAAPLRAAFIEVLSNPMVRIYIAVLTLGSGQMFGMLSSVQQVFDITFDLRENFPLYFMGIALMSGSGTLLNARLVMRLGMRRLAIAAYATQTVLSIVLVLINLLGLMPETLALPAFVFWAISVFCMAGLTFGNLNALALQPMGHIAGMAASVVGGVSTVLAVLIAVPIGLAFDGSPVPLMIGILLCSATAWWLMRKSREADPTPKKTIPAPG